MGKCLSSPAALVVYIPLEASPTPPRRFDAPMATMLRGRMHMGHTEPRAGQTERFTRIHMEPAAHACISICACVRVCVEEHVREKRDKRSLQRR